MRKVNVICGIIFLAIGASLFLYSTYTSSPLRTVFDDQYTIDANSYHYFMNNVAKSGIEVYSEYSASDEVEFFVLDSENFELFRNKYKEGELFTTFFGIYPSFGNSDSYTFYAPNVDEYYAVLLNDGDNDVNASFKQLEEDYFLKDTTGGISFFFLLIGFIALIIGIIQKPKTVETNKSTAHNEAS